MSTKAIREALVKGTECGRDSSADGGCGGCARKHAAFREVEAIEKAAKVLARCSHGIPMDVALLDLNEAEHLLSVIAKDAK